MLEAVLERITYANEETGYTIARVATEPSVRDLLTVVGALLGAQPGESLRLVGRWGSHPQYGRQFEVDSYTTVLPATIQGIERYLGSGLIKGIGPVIAERIVGHFGVDTLRVIEEEPGRLVEVPGLGPKRTAMIAAAWEEQKAIKEVMVFLQGVGVSTSLAVRIYKKYGDASISVVRNEPYRLAADVWGIGFKTADTIAQAVGIPHDSPQRVQGRHPVHPVRGRRQRPLLPARAEPDRRRRPDPRRARRPGPRLPGRAGRRARAWSANPSRTRRRAAGRSRRCTWCRSTAPRPSLAAALLRLLARPGRPDARASPTVDWDKALAWLRARTGAELAAEQEQAVRLALTAKVAVLTGGPGCGKSFTVKSVDHAGRGEAGEDRAGRADRAGRETADRADRAPGRHRAPAAAAAPRRRPHATTGTTRSTPTWSWSTRPRMLDLILANKLIKAVPPGAHLLLVGDVDQLPSVGAGEVLRDLLAADTIPRVRLTQIFRQAQQSGVVVNAHRINAGQPPVLGEHPRLLPVPRRRARGHRRAGGRRGRPADPAPVRPRPPRDIQVLDPDAPRPGRRRRPQHPAAAGARPAPGRDCRSGGYGGRVFRVGDKVIQIRNNYDKGAAGVFNGTVGVVTALSVDDQQLTVRTDEDEDIDYDFDELDELPARLRHHHAPLPGQRIPGRGHPADHQRLDDAAAQPALHRRHPGQDDSSSWSARRKALAIAVRTAGAGRRHTALTHRLQKPGNTAG